MSCLLQEQGAEGSSVGEMMNSLMPEEQVMAVFGSLRPALNTFCPKIEQFVLSAMQDCRKICPNTGHMGCAAPSSVPDSGNGCSRFVYKVDYQEETWEQGRTIVVD